MRHSVLQTCLCFCLWDNRISFPSIRVYLKVTLVVLLALKNSHAGNDLDNCLAGEFVLCTMATGFLLWSSFFDPLPVTVCGGTPRLCHCGGNDFVRERKSPSEVSVKRPELEPLSCFRVENSHQQPINRNPTFYSTSPLRSNSPSPLQPCRFESGFSFLNSVFCYSFLLVIARLEESPDGSPVISACSL